MKYKIEMLDGECWWGGSSNDGTVAPYDKDTDLARDFRVAASNQTMPMYISNMGRCIWSENPFACKIKNGFFELVGSDVRLTEYGSTLRDAYLGAMNDYFKPCGDALEKEFAEVDGKLKAVKITLQAEEKRARRKRELDESLPEKEKFFVPPSGLNPNVTAIASISVDFPVPFSPTIKVTGFSRSM